MKNYAPVLFLLLLGLGGCDYHSARDEFDRQIEVCTAGERNGVLDVAVEACGAALAIAEENAYAPDLMSGLLFRLGRLERQRGRFEEAEALVRSSLELEEQSGKTAAIAVRLVELSLSLAGQGRWMDGAESLEQVAPSMDDLTGKDRQAAANAFRAFGMRLGKMGHTAQAEEFKARAEELTGS